MKLKVLLCAAAATMFWLPCSVVVADECDSPDLFGNPLYLTDQMNIRAIKTGDLDGDGHPEIVTVSTAGSQLEIHRNCGQGTFATPLTLDSAAGQSDVHIADFDADGAPDILVVAALDRRVLLFRNSGTRDLAFDTPVDLDASIAPSSALIANMNHDAHLDIVVAHNESTFLTVLLNNGHGEFGPGEHYHIELGPHSLAAADIDGDGDVDLGVASEFTDNVWILENNGDGILAVSPIRYEASESIVNVSFQDLTNDGVRDLCVVSKMEAKLEVFPNFGFGVFGPPEGQVIGGYPGHVEWSDQFDSADGTSAGFEMIVSDTPYFGGRILRRNEDGYFAERAQFHNHWMTGLLAVADINGDGSTDIVTTYGYYHINEFNIIFNDGHGRFPERPTIETGFRPIGLAVSDFDEDGYVDFASQSFFGHATTIYMNDGNGVFEAGSTLDSELSSFGVRACDVDLDGHTDLVMSHFGDDAISICFGHGDGTFTEPMESPVGAGPGYVQAQDINGDGAPDLTFVCRLAFEVRGLINDGDRKFHIAELIQCNADCWHTVGIDSKMNGKNDLVLIQDNGMLLYENNGRGEFVPGQIISNDKFSRALVADMNNDGAPDIVASDWCCTDSIYVFLNSGDGKFASPIIFEIENRIQSLDIADIDNDGDKDVLAGVKGHYFNYGNGHGELVAFLNDGTGDLSQRVKYHVGKEPESVGSADFDNDGDLDVIVANSDEDTLMILKNRTKARLCHADLTGDQHVDAADLADLMAAWGPCFTCAEDLNNDNVVDTRDLLALLHAWGACPN